MIDNFLYYRDVLKTIKKNCLFLIVLFAGEQDVRYSGTENYESQSPSLNSALTEDRQTNETTSGKLFGFI